MNNLVDKYLVRNDICNVAVTSVKLEEIIWLGKEGFDLTLRLVVRSEFCLLCLRHDIILNRSTYLSDFCL